MCVAQILSPAEWLAPSAGSISNMLEAILQVLWAFKIFQDLC